MDGTNIRTSSLHSFPLCAAIGTDSQELTANIAAGIQLVGSLVISCFAMFIQRKPETEQEQWHCIIRYVSNGCISLFFVIMFPAAMFLDQQRRHSGDTPDLEYEDILLGASVCLLTPVGVAVFLSPPFWLYVSSVLALNAPFIVPFSKVSVRFRMIYFILLVMPMGFISFLDLQLRDRFIDRLKMQKLRIETEQALVQQQEAEHRLLTATNQARTMLLSAAAHDMRTPMCAVASGCKTLQRVINKHQTDFPATEMGRVINMMNVAAEVGEGTVTNLLTASRLLNGERVEPSLKPCQLKHLTEKMVMLAETAFGNPRVRITIAMQGVVPDVVTDEMWVQRMLMNLLTNALKFATVIRCLVSVGETQPILSLAARKDAQLANYEKVVMFQVQDNGCGIPHAVGQSLFHSTVDPSETGTGIGLYTLGEMSMTLGGGCGYQNNASGGTTVWFCLPIPDAQPKEMRVGRGSVPSITPLYGESVQQLTVSPAASPDPSRSPHGPSGQASASDASTIQYFR